MYKRKFKYIGMNRLPFPLIFIFYATLSHSYINGVFVCSPTIFIVFCPQFVSVLPFLPPWQ